MIRMGRGSRSEPETSDYQNNYSNSNATPASPQYGEAQTAAQRVVTDSESIARDVDVDVF